MARQETIPYLASEWDRLMDICKVPPGKGRLHTFAQLVTAYTEPHRHYHNLEHIRWMLDLLFDVELVDPFIGTICLRLATWYHDVVYDPRSSENESRSAVVARLSLGELEISDSIIARVSGLILMTKNHVAPPQDAEADLFLDADLGIIGADAESYAQYASAIRKEYDWVPERQFYEGRRTVLQRFQDRYRIFRASWPERFSEERARTNIAAEIAQIDEILRTLPS